MEHAVDDQLRERIMKGNEGGGGWGGVGRLLRGLCLPHFPATFQSRRCLALSANAFNQKKLLRKWHGWVATTSLLKSTAKTNARTQE